MENKHHQSPDEEILSRRGVAGSVNEREKVGRCWSDSCTGEVQELEENCLRDKIYVIEALNL